MKTDRVEFRYTTPARPKEVLVETVDRNTGETVLAEWKERARPTNPATPLWEREYWEAWQEQFPGLSREEIVKILRPTGGDQL